MTTLHRSSLAKGPYQRHDKRYRDPTLRLDLAGRECDTEDWSLGGFRAQGFWSPEAVGRFFDGAILNEDGIVLGRFTAQLVTAGHRAAPARFRFHRLSNAAFDLLQGYVLRPH